MYELEPAALRPGSTIKFIAPSSLLRDVEISTGIRFLQKQGFKVVFSPSITHASPTSFFTTGDYLRKQELENAFKSDDVDAIIALRGGAGAIDLLSIIDYDVIKDHPKIFVGYSDLTLLQLAFLKKAHLVSFQGPMFIDLLEKDNSILTYNWDTLLKVVKDGEMLELKNPAETKWAKTVIEGKAKGTIIGGNMSMVSLIANTEFMPSTQNALLFLEDSDVPSWMVDNILTSLVIRGIFNEASGVFFGEFPHEAIDRMMSAFNPTSYLLEDLSVDAFVTSSISDVIIDILTKKIKKPSFIDFSCCHGRYITTVPIGIQAELDAESSVKMLEKAVD